ncbi:MAG TPA: glycosyltransferase, partial [Longimicrobiales bacterium]|nr:glycosyltransferase [Longimicrobiales bacterium]
RFEVTDAAVSVIIPAYNARPWIGDAIESALRQTHPPREVIIVDDGSEDGTDEMVLARFGDRVRVLRQENRGLAAARNAGLAAAGGELIQFLDADDVLLDRKLEKQVALLGRAPRLDVAYCDYAFFADGRPEHRWPSGHEPPPADSQPLLHLIRGNTIAVHAALSRRVRIQEIGGFDESLGACEDLDLWLRMAAAGCRFQYIPEVLVLYRVRPGSMSGDAVRQAEWTIEVLTRADRPELPGPARQAVRRSLIRFRNMLVLARLRNALTLLRQGRIGAGAAGLLRALATDPLGIPGRIARLLTVMRPGRRR